MTKKTLGYVELEWTCPNCGNKNPGLKKTCVTCGSPQPQSAQFELGQQRELISDAQKAASAAKGADIYCPYCNTRNPSGAQACVQCGGDLKDALKRESGRVLNGAPAQALAPVTCTACGTVNPPGSLLCKSCGAQLGAASPAVPPSGPPPAAKGNSTFRPWMALPIIGVLLLCCVVVGFLFFRTSAVIGVVTGSQWQRTIAIEAQREVNHEDWKDQLPAHAKVQACTQKYRSRQDNPAPGAKEVCSTQLVDQGNGSAKVEETCYYEIYADSCTYTALEWQNVDQAQASGTDLQPYWPQFNLSNGQREGDRNESYTVDFSTKDGASTFTTQDGALYSQLEPGTQWTLTINALGGVVEVSPP